MRAVSIGNSGRWSVVSSCEDSSESDTEAQLIGYVFLGRHTEDLVELVT
jgi:hypothetical protein